MTGTAATLRAARNQPNVFVSRSGQSARATIKLLKGPWVDIWASGAKNPIRLDAQQPEISLKTAHLEVTGPPKGSWSAEVSSSQHWVLADGASPSLAALEARTKLVHRDLSRPDLVGSEIGSVIGRHPPEGPGGVQHILRLELTPQRGVSPLFRPVNGSGDWCTVTLTVGPWLSVWAVLNPSPMVLRPLVGGDTVKFWTTRFQMVGPDDQDWAAELDPGENWYPDISFPL